jgi:hypothetical protein
MNYKEYGLLKILMKRKRCPLYGLRSYKKWQRHLTLLIHKIVDRITKSLEVL